VSDGAYLVTGASRGIGAAVARKLAAPGRLIAINYRSSEKEAAQVAADVESRGARALLLKADVTRADEVEAMFEKLPAEGLAGLVCNAGASPRYGRLHETPPDEFERQWRSQAYAAALCCRKALPAMLKRKAGRVVFVVSAVAESRPPAFLGAYVSAKYALLGLAKALEAEAGPRGITVSCVFPRMTDTAFIKDFPRPIVEEAAEAQGGLDSPETSAERVAAALGVS
jgi:3-oxoacyl-[acyl-carrier protein] reductase